MKTRRKISYRKKKVRFSIQKKSGRKKHKGRNSAGYSGKVKRFDHAFKRKKSLVHISISVFLACSEPEAPFFLETTLYVLSHARQRPLIVNVEFYYLPRMADVQHHFFFSVSTFERSETINVTCKVILQCKCVSIESFISLLEYE